MSDEKQLALLIETLENHGIPFNGKDFLNALDKQSESAIETWIDEHLGSETLLTKEEHLLYAPFAPQHDKMLSSYLGIRHSKGQARPKS